MLNSSKEAVDFHLDQYQVVLADEISYYRSTDHTICLQIAKTSSWTMPISYAYFIVNLHIVIPCIFISSISSGRSIARDPPHHLRRSEPCAEPPRPRTLVACAERLRNQGESTIRTRHNERAVIFVASGEVPSLIKFFHESESPRGGARRRAPAPRLGGSWRRMRSERFVRDQPRDPGVCTPMDR
ncbi:hypothetical protein EVAR_43993_1 [Eumeta japonica]|uniref:Uncharacterized protein n=1 Tax=Eumeta variegata TaxID=151549 RepID=A0A4C1XEX2_EUMVA|nr:hypothetical protein EVAR_43993_1 [Eumeta japonica]